MLRRLLLLAHSYVYNFFWEKCNTTQKKRHAFAFYLLCQSEGIKCYDEKLEGF